MSQRRTSILPRLCPAVSLGFNPSHLIFEQHLDSQVGGNWLSLTRICCTGMSLWCWVRQYINLTGATWRFFLAETTSVTAVGKVLTGFHHIPGSEPKMRSELVKHTFKLKCCTIQCKAARYSIVGNLVTSFLLVNDPEDEILVPCRKGSLMKFSPYMQATLRIEAQPRRI